MGNSTRLIVVIQVIVEFEIACGLICATLYKRMKRKWINGFLLGIIANLWGVIIAYIEYVLEKSASDQIDAMGELELKELKARVLKDQCSICHEKLDFQRSANGVGALLDLEHLTSRVPYKCRSCNTIVCYTCASTGHSGCPQCGGKVFDQDSSRMK